MAMMLAVVGFPDLDADDRHWIESYRASHDPQAARLSVHFTFVFPLEASLEEIEAEVADVAAITAPIAFEIRRMDLVADASGKGCHIVLVPDEGSAPITVLHQRLSGGGLRPHHRADVPYVAHLTVGWAAEPAAARRAAAALDVRDRIVRGTVEALDIVNVSAPRIRSVATYPLRGQ